MNKIGISFVGDSTLEILGAGSGGSPVFHFGEGVIDGLTFHESVRQNLPLDPPLLPGVLNWDALSDSLWGGIFGLEAEDVLLIWRGCSIMKKNDPFNYSIACEILDSIAQTLNDPQYCRGRVTRLRVFMSCTE